MVRRLPWGREVRGSLPAGPCRIIPVTRKLVLYLLLCQAPGVMGSGLELVYLVPENSDWLR